MTTGLQGFWAILHETRKTKGKTFGRTKGYIPAKVRALEAKVLELAEQGQSYRAIASELKLSKNTVMGIVKRSKADVCAR
jgi:DNA-binding NarL/FixJ family response regulator